MQIISISVGRPNVESRLLPPNALLQFITINIEIILLHVHGENARIYIELDKGLWSGWCLDAGAALI